eukprot:TRINITY_DN7518_c0_g1_i4.p1 TRINITY_DN7518_c0_g1~~TRINITY_DN7518_c0_g1_i4.p1  ORF type:complete len:1259 (-),score=380.49 TRINITY_DN7518_c0_g1_i4:64-3840(-)
MFLISAQTHEELSSVQNLAGIAAIDTAQLDGETNLKQKFALPELSGFLTADQLFKKLVGTVRCEAPNEALDKFTGQITLDSATAAKLAIRAPQMLLRGCTLRNTICAYGLVTMAGPETKIQMNLDRIPTRKLSQVEQAMNTQVRWMFLLLFFMCLASAIGGGIWLDLNGNDAWYLALDGQTDDAAFRTDQVAASGILLFFTTIILLNTLIPISLYVNVEILKLVVSWWIDWDAKMYSVELDKTAVCRNTAITEELGQVQYVLSDKTGTLTQNKMELLRLVVNGELYGQLYTEIELSEANHNGAPLTQPTREKFENEDPKLPFYDENLNGLRWTEHEHKAMHRDFLVGIALCNQVRPEETSTGTIKFNAGNPDDFAIVSAAAGLGMVMCEAEPIPGDRTAVVLGERQPDGSLYKENYEILYRVEFSSLRKRMSVIVKMADGTFRIITKGADNIILSLLEDRNSPVVRATAEHITACATLGLRTLLVAQRILSVEEISAWQDKFNENKHLSLDEVEDAQQALGESLEQGLQVVGGTAIEDKLQEDVGEALSTLREAGIRTWVLTGDKVDTAIRIGHACKLLTQQMETVVIKERTTNGEAFKASELMMQLRTQHQAFKASLLQCNHLASMSDTERTAVAQEMHRRDTRMTQDLHAESAPAVSSPEAYKEQVEALSQGDTALELAIIVEGLALEKLGIGVQGNGSMWRLLAQCRDALKDTSEKDLLEMLEPTGKEDWMSLDETLVDKTIAALDLMTKMVKDKKEEHLANANVLGEILLAKLNQVEGYLSEADDVVHNLKAWRTEFITICGECNVVLCCRVSPKQKADVVSYVKTVLKKITLAIGDGANDVNMILEAHVGVGISGVEGTSAVNNADYALPQFKGVARLMLVHGRLCYLRITTLICYFFYKNFLFTLCIFLFNCYAALSGQFCFNEWGVSLYNTIFTQMPVLVFAILEHDVRPDCAMMHPQLYHAGQRSELFNTKVFLLWIAEGVWGGCVCFFVPLYFFNIADPNGQLLGLWATGTAIMTCVVMTVTFRICVETVFWTWIHVFWYGISLASWFIFVAVFSNINYPQPAGGQGDSSSYGINEQLSPLAMYWILGFTTAFISLTPNFIRSALTATSQQDTRYKVRFQEQFGCACDEKKDAVSPSPRAGDVQTSTNNFVSVTARMTLDMTDTYDGNSTDDDASRAGAVQQLITSAVVVRVAKRWVRRWKQRQAAKSGALELVRSTNTSPPKTPPISPADVSMTLPMGVTEESEDSNE